jgi:hypothetical protein
MKTGVGFMKIKTEKITGDLYILSDAQYNDVNADTIKVKENVTTRLYGIINKDLVVGKNARVYMHGKIYGKVRNNGGSIYLFEDSGDVSSL